MELRKQAGTQVAGEAFVEDQKRTTIDTVVFIVVSPPFDSNHTDR